MKKYFFFLMLFSFALFQSCEIEEIVDPNSSSLGGVQNGAKKSELQTLVTGIESLLRKEIGFYYDAVSIIGREYYFFTGSDPRYTGELLGKESSTLDPAGFYGTRPFAGRYRTVKNANILISAVENSDDGLTDAQKNGYYGFAKLASAYELHLALNLQFNNGIRLDVSDPNNLGSFQSYDASLAGIMSLLDEAVGHFSNAGGDFVFSLSSGFDGFNTPATMAQFAQGMRARIALYQGKNDTALDALGKSFLDLDGDLDAGPFRTYSTAGGETTNPLFRATNQADGIIAHPDFVAALTEGDARASKIAMRDAPLTLDGLSGEFDVVLYPSFSAPIKYMRNEELILIYAEANIGSNSDEAVKAINAVRTGNGLSEYDGATSSAALLDEVLRQRRLSLFGEGHRWVDLRRLGRLGELPLDRPGDDVWEQFPRPDSEV